MAAQHLAELSPRHIQDFHNANNTVWYWGYAHRVVPCTNDPGSCEYLDLVYNSHVESMLFAGKIMWPLILGILLAWAILRKVFPSATKGRVTPSASAEGGQAPSTRTSTAQRLRNSIASFSRRWFLPESMRWAFGHVTRLQVAVMAIIVAYLTIFTFAGIYYRSWITPVKNMEGVFNHRSSLGPWSNRIGVFAYALTPLSVMLASRESILSILTGIPYQSFIFMHRWLGWVIFLQSALHTIGWSIIEIRLYQPQPKVGLEWIRQTYMIWGLVAMGLLAVLVLLSTKYAIRAFGYEFFRKAHYVLAMVYIGACIAHWELLSCFLIPGLLLWGIDRFARLVRTALLHRNRLGSGSFFKSAQASVQLFEDPLNGDVVRLDFDHPQQPWDVGQHFYLCFPELNIWQSHPMTPLSPPGMPTMNISRHSYVIRAKAGETKKLAQLAAKKLGGAESGGSAVTEKKVLGDGSSTGSSSDVTPTASISVVLTGPYGQSITRGLHHDANILCVAGGTGVTFVLPVLLDIVRAAPVPGRRIEFMWAIRHTRDMDWAAAEIAELRGATESHNLHIDVFVTRDQKSSRSALEAKVEDGAQVEVHLAEQVEDPQIRRPSMDAVVDDFMSKVVTGSTTVYASGPLEMIGDLRAAVARQNDAGKVWRGEERFNVRLVNDDRIEW